MMRNPVIRFDNPTIGRARKLRAEALALRRQSRALKQRILANHTAIRGISNPMLMEIAYDLTALGLHDLSWVCHTVAEGIASKRVAGDPAPISSAPRRPPGAIFPRGPAVVGGRTSPPHRDPAEYRKRAKAWREKAASLFEDQPEQALYLGVADGYEKLATRIEQLAQRSA